MASPENKFDFIFAGGGMAAASLLLRLIAHSEFREKRILIADPMAFSGPEKTWCFWEKGDGFFESIIEKTWDRAWFHAPGFSSELNLNPYRYKMLRSAAFYKHTMEQLDSLPNIKIIQSEVNRMESIEGMCRINLQNGDSYESPLLFNSIPAPEERKEGHFYLLQHFRGWFVKTAEDVFDKDSATLMDFRISQKGDCRFVYVLPSGPNEALVEYTVFSETLLPENEYEGELANYMKTLSPSGFELIQKESGVIPMYSEPFPVSQVPGLIQIGTSGGMTKASTGYTFRKVQKHSEAIVSRLLKGQMPDEKTLNISPRYFWFDRVLLRVLAEKVMPGRDIFLALFRKNPPERVFRFLDEESMPLEELKIMNSVPAFKFMIPGIKELLRDLR